jgi:Ca-activated chloride channel family protein
MRKMIDACGITDKKGKKTDCPLQSVEVTAILDGSMALVTLVQSFMNTGSHDIEALYTFPMPHNAQVTGFKAGIGDTEVTGDFREKEQAFEEYDKAVRGGDTAFLLESHRPDIFQISLGNIAKGEQASITILYIEDINCVDSELRWILPTVVAPRYIPGKKKGAKTGPGEAHPTEKVPDADYITPSIGEAPYHLSIRAVLKGVLGIKKVSSPSHPVEVSIEKDAFVVTLAKEGELLDNDFVLVAQIEKEDDCSLVVARHYNGQAYGIARFAIEIDDYTESHKNYEYNFMIDISGSMCGEKIEQAKRALGICLRNLMPGDKFNIVAFESEYICFSLRPVLYSQENMQKADSWINALDDRGGTEIYQPLKFVLDKAGDNDNLEKVIFLFTDGQVGNEREIIRLVRQNNKSVYVYPFGIDTAVNKYFIDGLAEAGNGMPEYVYPGERIEDKVIRQFSRIHQPFIANPMVADKDGTEITVSPAMPGRLYSSETYCFSLKSEMPEQLNNITVSGDIGEEKMTKTISAAVSGDAELLSRKWAKEKIKVLEGQLGSGNERRDKLIKKEIIELSMQYSLLSTLTSLVAVYKRTVKATGLPETVVVPVSKPRGWDMFDSPAVSAVAGGAVFRFVSAPAPMCCEESHIPFAKAKKSETVNDLADAIRRAAEKQNADGTFGAGKNAGNLTSYFIIGMLLAEDAWKPYRIQIMKAGRALLAIEDTDKVLKVAAINLILQAKIDKSREMQVALKNTVNTLTEEETAMLDALKAGDTKPFMSYVLPRFKKEDCISKLPEMLLLLISIVFPDGSVAL